MKQISRCSWCLKDELYINYHDQEWGDVSHDDLVHFEYLVLESAQAGLSWYTVLKKRAEYRRCFANFNPKKVATFTDSKVEELLLNKGLIRNRAKIVAAINNAKLFLQIQKEWGSFDKYLWSFVNNKQIVYYPESIKDLKPKNEVSDAIAKDLKKRGFKFLGSTIIYAHLQAVGVIDEHLISCFKKKL
jgi:DNA-3-methyladenine glycosylase I